MVHPFMVLFMVLFMLLFMVWLMVWFVVWFIHIHVCWTKMMFFELPKGWDQYFSTWDSSLFQGICVLKSNLFTFWYFCPKNGSKGLKIGLKCLILVLYGMVWLISSKTRRNQTSNLAILENWKEFLGSAMTQDHNLAKPNLIIPIQNILSPFFGPFWPIYRPKVPKSKWIWFEDTYPLNQ